MARRQCCPSWVSPSSFQKLSELSCFHSSSGNSPTTNRVGYSGMECHRETLLMGRDSENTNFTIFHTLKYSLEKINYSPKGTIGVVVFINLKSLNAFLKHLMRNVFCYGKQREVIIEERKDLTSFSYKYFWTYINEQSRRSNMAGAVANVVHQLLVSGHRLSTRISDDVAVPDNSNWTFFIAYFQPAIFSTQVQLQPLCQLPQNDITLTVDLDISDIVLGCPLQVDNHKLNLFRVHSILYYVSKNVASK